jgi:hypothetical protein
MSDGQYQSLFQSVAKHVANRKYDSALEQLKGLSSVRDVYVLRAFYLVYSDENSPAFNKESARGALDFLDAANDSWGMAEKGRCLYVGLFYVRDVSTAEDTLVRASKKEAKAEFYIAQIHDLGAHEVDGESVRDVEYAMGLYLKLMKGSSPYKHRSAIAYCRLLQGKGELNPADKRQVFEILLTYFDKTSHDRNSQQVAEMLFSFLNNEMRDLVIWSFSGRMPSGMSEKIDFETSRSLSLSSLDTLEMHVLKHK